MTTWTNLECLQSDFSDFFKEVYGIRPRWMTDEQWNSEEWLEQAIAGLTIAAEENRELENARAARAINALEDQIATLIQCEGASDRETAIRWLMQAEDIDTVDCFEFRMGVPFGYLAEAQKIVDEVRLEV